MPLSLMAKASREARHTRVESPVASTGECGLGVGQLGMDLREWRRFTELPRVDALVGRVSTSSRNPIFMVGSGMSLPEKPGAPGIPGAAGMVELVRNRLSDEKTALAALNLRLARAEQEVGFAYSAAFDLLAQWRGPDAVDNTSNAVPDGASARGAAIGRCHRTRTRRRWLGSDTRHKRARVPARREWQTYPDAMVLTTNFDPMLSIAIKRAHGRPRRVILDGDGPLPSIAESVSLMKRWSSTCTATGVAPTHTTPGWNLRLRGLNSVRRWPGC